MINKLQQIIELVNEQYSEPKIALNYTNGLELIVAVILSAQCTDKRVNIVTNVLFSKYKTLADYITVPIEEFEQDIRSTGFYRNKAKNIKAMAQKVKDDFDGKIPGNMEDLISLPGVARKTANVVLNEWFDKIEGICVDTHVMRLSQRLGFSDKKNAVKVEEDLMSKLPKKYWKKISLQLIDHGRKVCEAKKPKCDECFLNKKCQSAFKFKHFDDLK